MSERGSQLETKISQWFKTLNDKGIHAHKNHPKRTITGLFQEGEPYDFEIFMGNKLYVFDAKECQNDKWYLSNAKPEQIKHLLNCANHGADAFFLVYFWKTKSLIKFSIHIILTALQTNKKHLTVEDGERFNLYVISQAN